MDGSHESLSPVKLAQIDKISEIAIFWSLLSTVIVVAIAMLKSMPIFV